MKDFIKNYVFSGSIFLFALWASVAQAAGTIEKIKQSSSLTLGFDISAPFSYLDANQQPLGYSIDICLKIAEALKRELKIPDLAVKYKPLADSSARFSGLSAGDFDLECGSSTNTAERRQLVSFTIPTFLSSIRVMVRKDSGIKNKNGLAGKKVVTTEGLNAEKVFKNLDALLNLKATLLLSKDDASSFVAFETGKADAFIMDDVTMFTLLAGSKNQEQFIILPEVLTVEPLTIVMRKNDPEFKKLVDAEVVRIISSGEITAIYKKWFETPIPPKQINLKLPMSYMLRDSFKVPSDKVAN